MNLLEIGHSRARNGGFEPVNGDFQANSREWISKSIHKSHSVNGGPKCALKYALNSPFSVARTPIYYE